MFRNIFIVLALIAGMAASIPAIAGDQGSLFVNLTSDESHRADMALTFSKNQLERGHPVTVFLNDRGVFVGAKSHAEKFKGQQQALAELMAKGAVVIVCPFCAKHYGIETANLIEGAKVGNPDLTGGLLFKEDTKTLTW
jgi:sulfur relay (sulfurtransferase) complex TusBCD TusD component (DsrE family)